MRPTLQWPTVSLSNDRTFKLPWTEKTFFWNWPSTSGNIHTAVPMVRPYTQEVTKLVHEVVSWCSLTSCSHMNEQSSLCTGCSWSSRLIAVQPWPSTWTARDSMMTILPPVFRSTNHVSVAGAMNMFCLISWNSSVAPGPDRYISNICSVLSNRRKCRLFISY